jgi:hypothetical protein
MGKSMSDPEIVMSPLCREITGDGTKVQVDIYRGEDESGWILEVIDEVTHRPSGMTCSTPTGKLWKK